MTIENANRTDTFKIGVVGPSRVGKTSLIAAVLRDSQKLLAGTPVELRADDVATEARINGHRNQLDGALRAGQFVNEAVRATQEPFVFELKLDSGNNETAIGLSMLDYPGGWLDPANRPELRQPDWEECRDFLRNSTVLVVPVDATILMEAVEARHKGEVPSILTIHDVAQIARSWAKERGERAGQEFPEPGLLLLCPLKCESYLADNGGQRDEAEKLEQEVRSLYAELVEGVKAESSSLEVLYAPIDTIGCVELVSGDWQRTSETAPSEFHAKYRVRPPGRVATKGADTVLKGVARHCYAARLAVEQQIARDARKAAKDAKDFAMQKEGLFRDMWLKITRERKRRHEIAGERSAEATSADARVRAFDDIIEGLSKAHLDPRVTKV